MARDAVSARAAAAAGSLLLLIGIGLLIPSGPAASQVARKPSLASDDALQLADFDQQGDRLELFLINTGRAPITVAQVQIDAAYWDFTISPGPAVAPSGRATLTLPYNWDQSQALDVSLVTSSGGIVTVGLTPEVGAYRIPVKSWRLLTPRQLATIVAIALAPLLLAWFLLSRPAAAPWPWREALLTASSAVILWQMVAMIVLDPDAASIRPGIWKGTTPLLLAALAGFIAAHLVRDAVARRLAEPRTASLWTAAVAAIACHAAAAGMTAADLAAKGQDGVIAQVLRQLLVFVILRAAVAVLADDRRTPVRPMLLAVSLVAVSAAALAAPLTAPTVRSQIWAPMLAALAAGVDGQLMVTAWRTRVRGLPAAAELLTVRGTLATIAALVAWVVVKTTLLPLL